MNGLIRKTQWNAWLLAAAVPAILSTVGRNGWLTVLLAAIVTGVLSLCALSCPKLPIPKWLRILELSWLAVFLGAMAGNADACWEQGQTFPAIGLILLILAAFAAQKGALRMARVGATLVWLVLPVIVLILLAGMTDAHTEWIRTDLELPDGYLVAILLLPAVSLFLPTETGKTSKWPICILGIVAVLCAIMLDSVLGARVASGADNAFYEFSKSVNLYGIAERFEAVVGCVLTIGWFLLFTILLSAAYHLSGNRGWAVWLIAALSGAIMCILPNGSNWTANAALIFWGFLPAITQGVVGAKNIIKK